MPAITTAILAATAIAGVATSAYGMSQQQKGLKEQQQAQQMQAQIASQQAGYNVNIAKDEAAQDVVRRQAMQLDAKRATIQNVRQAQQARSMSIAAATAQGAGFAGGFGASSGAQGGLAQVNARNNFNLTGINQNLQAGESMFNLNADISTNRVNLANSGAQMATAQGMFAQGQGVAAQGQGFMSFGSSLVNAASTFGNVAGSLAGTSTPAGFGQSAYNPARIGSLY